MSRIHLFDANCLVGRYKRFHAGSFYSTERLLEEMDYYGIEEALVLHALSREHHPAAGNSRVLEDLHGSSRLHPAWSLLPSRSGEMPKPESLIDDMARNDVRAVWIFPSEYFFSLSDWCMGDTFGALEGNRIPTFISFDSQFNDFGWDKTDWDAIDHICSTYPNLPVILSEARFRTSNRLLYHLMDRNDNLHMELSGYWLYRGIEFLSREFGPERLLFGTRLPVRDPACAITMLTYAEMGEREKQLIGGDNLRRLMRWGK